MSYIRRFTKLFGIAIIAFIALPFIIGIIVLIFSAFVPFYSYGVDKSQANLEYHSYLGYDVDKEIETTSVLYAENPSEELESGYNLAKGFIAYVDHPSPNTYEAHDDLWEVKLGFHRGRSTTTFSIEEKSIIYSLKTDTGQEIYLADSNSTDLECYEADPERFFHCWVEFKFPLDKPLKDLVEHVKVNLVVNGKEIQIEEQFPIRLHKTGTGLDGIMGI